MAIHQPTTLLEADERIQRFDRIWSGWKEEYLAAVANGQAEEWGEAMHSIISYLVKRSPKQFLREDGPHD
jgi:hypothetical protein